MIPKGLLVGWSSYTLSLHYDPHPPPTKPKPENYRLNNNFHQVRLVPQYLYWLLGNWGGEVLVFRIDWVWRDPLISPSLHPVSLLSPSVSLVPVATPLRQPTRPRSDRVGRGRKPRGPSVSRKVTDKWCRLLERTSRLLHCLHFSSVVHNYASVVQRTGDRK